MDIELADINNIIKVNKMQPVSNPILFNRMGEPSYDGLLSTEIFGMTTSQKESNFAYIDLHGKYMTPEAYKAFKRLNRNIELVVSGAERFSINEDGSLVKDENGDTGIKWLYKNWDKIKFTKSKSSTRNERVDLLKNNSKDIIFVDKWIVIPVLYRDVESQTTKVGNDNVNSLYSKLIRYASMASDINTFDIMLYSYEYGIQNTLVEIYDYFKTKIAKKNGVIRKNLMGKSVDYSARLVITAPNFNFNNFHNDMKVDLYHCGLPLSTTISLFFPFILNWLRDWFQRELEPIKNKFPYKEKDKIKYINIKEPMTYFTDEYLTKKVKYFMKSYEDRFSLVEIPVKEPKDLGGREYVTLNTEGHSLDDGSVLFSRDLTWADLLYRAAIAVVKDKHIVVTRYPVLSYFGSYVSKIHVMSTIKTIKVEVDNYDYENYPVIDLSIPKNQVSTIFIDTLNMCNLLLEGLGGDYDGDQVTIKGIFSQEANLEAENIMTSPSYIIDVYGKNTRGSTKEALEAAYQITKE